MFDDKLSVAETPDSRFGGEQGQVKMRPLFGVPCITAGKHERTKSNEFTVQFGIEISPESTILVLDEMWQTLAEHSLDLTGVEVFL